MLPPSDIEICRRFSINTVLKTSTMMHKYFKDSDQDSERMRPYRAVPIEVPINIYTLYIEQTMRVQW